MKGRKFSVSILGNLPLVGDIALFADSKSAESSYLVARCVGLGEEMLFPLEKSGSFGYFI